MNYDYKAGSPSLEWMILFFYATDAILLKECGHMWPGPQLDVVWAVSTYMHLEYIHVWPSNHQPVIQGLSRDNVLGLVLNPTQSLHEVIRLIHDLNSQDKKIVSTLESSKWSITVYTIFRVTPFWKLPCVYVFWKSRYFDICIRMVVTGCLPFSNANWLCLLRVTCKQISNSGWANISVVGVYS